MQGGKKHVIQSGTRPLVTPPRRLGAELIGLKDTAASVEDSLGWFVGSNLTIRGISTKIEEGNGLKLSEKYPRKLHKNKYIQNVSDIYLGFKIG